jgi:hypothetical protein
MNENKKLYKQIEDLNNKIKKLESVVSNKKQIHLEPNDKNITNLSKSSLVAYRIHFPKESYSKKKYIGLKFDDNLNDYDSNESSNYKNLLSFIKLIKSNVIINYTIQLELNYISLNPIHCSIAIGIKTSTNTKIKIIKGTKYNFDLSSNIIDNILNISYNILYSAEEGDELCVIADFDFASGSHCFVNSKKSIIKLLYV